MKKDLGVKPYVFPMPVLMIATYDDEEKVDVMNMAWGGICDDNMVALNISEGHQTADNIKKRMAFTLSIADIDHLEESDYFGTVSGRNVEDKFERTGMHAIKSARVDAPIILDYPLTLECKVVELDAGTYSLLSMTRTALPSLRRIEPLSQSLIFALRPIYELTSVSTFFLMDSMSDTRSGERLPSNSISISITSRLLTRST